MHKRAFRLPTLTIDKWARPGAVKPVRPPARSMLERSALAVVVKLSAWTLKAGLYWTKLSGSVCPKPTLNVVVISSGSLVAGQPLPAGASALNFTPTVLVLSKPVSDGKSKAKEHGAPREARG